MTPLPAKLSTKQIDSYQQDGFVFPLPAIGPAKAAQYRQALEKYEARAGKPLSGKYKHKVHLLFTWASELEIGRAHV